MDWALGDSGFPDPSGSGRVADGGGHTVGAAPEPSADPLPGAAPATTGDDESGRAASSVGRRNPSRSNRPGLLEAGQAGPVETRPGETGARLPEGIGCWGIGDDVPAEAATGSPTIGADEAERAE